MKTSKLTSVILILLVGTLQLSWYAMVYTQTLIADGYIQDLDFRIFYTSGQIARAGDWQDVYDFEHQLEAQRQLTGLPLEMKDLLPFNHPPVLLPLQWLVAGLDYLEAYLLWNLLTVLAIFFNSFLIFRSVRRLGWELLPSWLFTFQGALFYPVFVSFCKGQDTVYALLGLTVFLAGMQFGQNKFAGLGLALFTLRPQLAIPLALPLIFKQRKAGVAFIVSAAILVVYSVLMVRWKGVLDFLNILEISASGETVLIHQKDMYNLKGMLIRSFPALDLNIIYGVSWAAFLLSILLISWLWVKSPKVETHLIGLGVVLSMFTAPHLHYHDLSFLLIPILAFCFTLTSKKILDPWQASLVLMGVSIYLAIIHISSASSGGIYLLMLVVVGLSWYAGWLAEKKWKN